MQVFLKERVHRVDRPVFLLFAVNGSTPALDDQVRKERFQHRLIPEPDRGFGKRIWFSLNHLRLRSADLLNVFSQFVGRLEGDRRSTLEDNDRRPAGALLHQHQFVGHDGDDVRLGPLSGLDVRGGCSRHEGCQPHDGQNRQRERPEPD